MSLKSQDIKSTLNTKDELKSFSQEIYKTKDSLLFTDDDYKLHNSSSKVDCSPLFENDDKLLYLPQSQKGIEANDVFKTLIDNQQNQHPDSVKDINLQSQQTDLSLSDKQDLIQVQPSNASQSQMYTIVNTKDGFKVKKQKYTVSEKNKKCNQQYDNVIYVEHEGDNELYRLENGLRSSKSINKIYLQKIKNFGDQKNEDYKSENMASDDHTNNTLFFLQKKLSSKFSLNNHKSFSETKLLNQTKNKTEVLEHSPQTQKNKKNRKTQSPKPKNRLFLSCLAYNNDAISEHYCRKQSFR